MSTHYYLSDGNVSKINTLYIPDEGNYFKDVPDIAYIDKVTIELGSSIKPVLKECNPGKFITDNRNYKIVRNPKMDKNLSIYYPVLFFNKDLPYNINVLVEQFMDLSLDRIKSFEYTGHVSNINEDKVDKFMAELLDYVYGLDYSDQYKLFNNQSILGKDVKTYYRTNAYNMKRILRNYTQLRNLLIMYLSIYYKNRPTPSLQDLKDINDNYELIEGLYQEDPVDIKQLLTKYREDLLKTKSEEERKELQDSLKDYGKQLTLSDFSQEYSDFVNKKK